MAHSFTLWMKVLVIFCFLISQYKSHSQCNITQSVQIADNTSTSISLLVNGAVINDLANSQQGVCNVLIKFRHSTVGDLNMTLISPDGSQVQLIGPGGGSANITQFTTWDISFLPCSQVADPDPGFEDQWDNQELWGIFATYEGSYYPFNDNCLEDFDTGPVNGTWTLLIDDVEAFDTGIIQEFSIIFCDDNGIDCNVCAALAPSITNDTLEICAGQSINYTQFQLIPPGASPDTNLYNTPLAVFNTVNNRLIAYLNPDSNLVLSPAQYNLCAVSVFEMDESALPNTGQTLLPSNFQDAINQAGICAEINESCQTLIINPVSDTIVRNETICNGDTLTINGKTFTNKGDYILTFQGIKCDTVTILKLNVINPKPIISTQLPAITCFDRQMYLYAGNIDSVQGVSYVWSTSTGNILGDKLKDSVLINAGGIYSVKAKINGCEDSTTISVAVDNALPNVTILASNLSCTNDSVLITISADKPIASADWTGPSNFRNIGNNIYVGSPGQYVATVIDQIGCEVISSIIVKGDFDLPQLIASIDTISCENDTVRLQIIDTSNIASVLWTGPFSVTNKTDINAGILSGGLYTLAAIGNNGCKDSFEINVADISYTINVSIRKDTITCDKQNITLHAVADKNIISYFWQGPSIINPPLDTQQINRGGIYSVLVTDINQCQGYTTQFILEDKLVPTIHALNDTISCTDTLAQLRIDNPLPQYKYFWRGPNNYTSVQSSPSVSVPGIYVVRVNTGNGCNDIDSLIIVADDDLPTLTFTFDTITCTNAIGTIYPSDTTNLIFTWADSYLTTPSNVPDAQFTIGGAKNLLITNRQTLCKNNFEVLLPDQRIYPTITVVHDSLDCDTDSIQLQTSANPPLSAIVWTDKNLFASNEVNPFITNAGTYYYTAFVIPGCEVTDSIEIIRNGNIPEIIAQDQLIQCDNPFTFISAISSNVQNYNWYYTSALIGTGSSIQVNSEGNYECIVQFLNGCIDTVEVTVSFDTIKPAIAISGLAFFDCVKMSTTLIGLSNEEISDYTWAGPGIITDLNDSIVVNKAGIYTLTVVDTSFCVSSKSTLVVDESDSVSVDVSLKQITCDSAAFISLSPNQIPKLVTWSGPIAIPDGTLNFQSNTVGVYNYEIISDANCSTQGFVTITKDTVAPIISNIIVPAINCFSSSSTILVNSNSQIDLLEINGPQNKTSFSDTISVSKNGNYILKIQGENGCISQRMIVVPIDTVKAKLTLMTDTISCKNSKIDIGFTADLPLVSAGWVHDNMQFPQANIKINQSGIYTAFGVTANGCKTEVTTIIAEDKATPNLNLQDTFLLPCDGSGVKLFVDSDEPLYFFRWVDGTNNLISNDSTVVVTNAQLITIFAASENGCNSIDTTFVALDTRRPIFGAINDTIFCNPPFADLIALNVSDDNDFLWLDAVGGINKNDTLRVHKTGVYKLVVEIANSCKDTLDVIVIQDTLHPTVDVTLTEPFKCKNTEVILQGNVSSTRPTQVSYEWTTQIGIIEKDGNKQSPTVSKEANYTFTATDTYNGCTSSIDYFLDYDERGIDDFTLASSNPVCKGDKNGTFSISNISGGIEPYYITIDDDTTTIGNISFDNLGSGTHRVIIKDSLGCEIDTMITLEDGISYDVELGEEILIYLGDSVVLNYDIDASINIDSSIWINENIILCNSCYDIIAKPFSTTTYFLQTVDANGCTSKDSVTIKVTDLIKIDLANVFMPNSNDENSIYKISNHNAVRSIDYVHIYDRWGNLVFTESNISDASNQVGWNGQINGTNALPGVYIMQCQVTLLNGKKRLLSTDISLIR